MLLETRNNLAKVVVDSTIDLFEAYGSCVQPAGTSSDPMAMHRAMDTAGVIGFAGPWLRGTLILGMSYGSLERIIDPTMRARAGEWVVELTNQLMGRIKNSLASFSLELEMSTPVGLSRFAVGRSCADEDPLHFSFSANGERCEVWFNAKVVAEIDWSQRMLGVHEEGSLCLF